MFFLKLLFGVILGSLLVDFWSLLVDFWKVVGAFLCKCLGDRSGTALGSTLGSFRTDFMNMFGVMLEVFFMKMKLSTFSLFLRIGGTGRKAFTIILLHMLPKNRHNYCNMVFDRAADAQNPMVSKM